MGHPQLLVLAARQKADAITHALSRVRGIAKVSELLSLRAEDQSVLEYARSLPDHNDVLGLEILLLDARSASKDIEKQLARVIQQVKSNRQNLTEKGEAFREANAAAFAALLDAQDVITGIDKDLKIIKDIVDDRPNRRPVAVKQVAQ